MADYNMSSDGTNKYKLNRMILGKKGEMGRTTQTLGQVFAGKGIKSKHILDLRKSSKGRALDKMKKK